MRYTILILLTVCLGFSTAYSQVQSDEFPPEGLPNAGLRKNILDDSTKLIYDFSTILYVNQSDVKYNYRSHHEIDTTLHDLENWSTMNKLDNKIQNLGNQGTASKEIFYDRPREIGLTSGLNAYDVYYTYPDMVKYFNTKSPFTNLKLVLANKSRSSLDVNFSRNISPGWNMGFDFNTQDIDKLLNSRGKNDTHIKTSQIDIYNWFRSKNKKYNLLAYFNRFEHNVYEQGGLLTVPVENLFKYNEAQVYLNNTKVKDLRYDFHTYQEFKWFNALTFYHELDLSSQKVTYFSVEDQLSKYPDPVFINNDTTDQYMKYSQVENDLGVKGFWRNWYYMLYGRHRNLNYAQKYISGKRIDNEFYVGGYMRLDLDSASRSNVSIEARLGVDGKHRLKGAFKSDYAELSYERTQYAAPYMTLQYFSNHLQWDNDFKDQQYDQVKAKLKIRRKEWLDFDPKFTLTNFANYVYYDTDRKPNQTSGFGQVWNLGADLNVTFLKYLHLDNEVIYSFTTGGSKDVFRIPKLFINSKLYYAGAIVQNKLHVETGVNFHFTTRYMADDYDPTSQQFYLQDTSLPEREGSQVQGFPIIDVYLSFRIKTFRAFFKYVNLNQAKGKGYFVTPYYTGPPSGLDFGIAWTFFD